jgi:20S proteasome alpha/beta subunit
MYKVDVGIGRKPKATKTKDAAKAVTKATSRDVNVGQNDKVWKVSDIQRLKPWEFEKYEAEIDQAMKSGRVINE